MVQSINDVSNVLTHITVDIPLSLKQFRSLVDQVGGQNLVDNAVLVSLVELVQTVGEEAEGGEDEDLVGFTLLQSSGNFNMLSPEEIISSIMIISLPSTLVPRNS